jgi:hypothetical protein
MKVGDNRHHILVQDFQRIAKEEQRFQKVAHFHVLQKLNQRTDHLAKEACKFVPGMLKQNQEISSSYIP